MTDAKTRILKAASSLFLEGGLPALSVRAIAKAAGVSTIGIYSYFQGKQGVLDALYIEGFGLVRDVLESTPSDLPPMEAALFMARRYLETAARYEAHYKLIFGEDNAQYEPSAEATQAAAAAFQALVDRIGGLLPKGADVERKRQAALQIWALAHGFVSLRRHAIGGYFEESWEELVMDAMRLHLTALRETPLVETTA